MICLNSKTFTFIEVHNPPFLLFSELLSFQPFSKAQSISNNGEDVRRHNIKF